VYTYEERLKLQIRIHAMAEWVREGADLGLEEDRCQIILMHFEALELAKALRGGCAACFTRRPLCFSYDS
jgi:hypothetical protein